MKIRLISDIHLEFSDYEIKNDDNHDVLILAGDITVVNKSSSFELYKKMILDVCAKFEHVIVVPGNHEFHYGEYYTVLADMRILDIAPNNYYLLYSNEIQIEDVWFYGTTLWTDVFQGDYHHKIIVEQGMNDYHCIRNFNIDRSIEINTSARQGIEHFLRRHKDDKTVVITHHLPDECCVNPAYNNDPLNGGFHNTNLSGMILEYEPDYWVFGHTHDSVATSIGKTKLLCNPRGYVTGYSFGNRSFQPNFYFEV